MRLVPAGANPLLEAVDLIDQRSTPSLYGTVSVGVHISGRYRVGVSRNRVAHPTTWNGRFEGVLILAPWGTPGHGH